MANRSRNTERKPFLEYNNGISATDIISNISTAAGLWSAYADGISQASAEADGHMSILESLTLKTNSLKDEFTGETQKKATAAVFDGLRGESSDDIQTLIDNNNALIEIHKRNGAEGAVRELTLSNSNMKIALEEAKELEKAKQDLYNQILNRPVDTLSSNQIESTIDQIQNERYNLIKAIDLEKTTLANLEQNRPLIDKRISELQELSKHFKAGSQQQIDIAKSIAKLQESRNYSESNYNNLVSKQREIIEGFEKELVEYDSRYNELLTIQQKPSPAKIQAPQKASVSDHCEIGKKLTELTICCKELITLQREYLSLTHSTTKTALTLEPTPQSQQAERLNHLPSTSTDQITEQKEAVITLNEAIDEQVAVVNASRISLQENTAATLEQQSQTQKLEQDQAASNQQTEQSIAKVEEQKIAIDDLNESLDGQAQTLNLVQQAQQEEAKATQHTVEEHKKAAQEISDTNKELLQETLQPLLSKLQEPFEEAMDEIDSIFAEAWLNIDDGFDGIAEGIEDTFDRTFTSIENSFKKMMAEMAHEAITRPILVEIQSAFSGESKTSAVRQTSSASSLLSLGSNIPGLTEASEWLGSTSISQNIAQYTSYSPGLSGAAATGPTADMGSSFAGNTGAAGPTNMQLGVAGIAGGIGANLIFGGKGQSGLGGSIGSSIGMFAGGPWTAALGMLLGGGFGSLFAGKGPKFDFRTRQDDDDFHFENEQQGVYARSAFGEIGFGAEDTRKLKSTFGGFENAEAFLDTIALIDNAIGSLAQSDLELQDMSDSAAALEVRAKSPTGVMEQMSDCWLLALSQTTSRLTEGMTAEAEQLTRRLGLETEDGSWIGDGQEDYGTVTISVESALMQAITVLEPNQMIGAMTSIISMERIADAIGGAVTNDLYASLESGIADDLDVTAVIEQLNGALTALPSLARFNDSFDILAAGALEVSGNIIELAGGLQKLSAQQAQYYDLYFTEEEKFEAYADQMAAAMGDLGLSLVGSHDAFRDLVEGLDLSTEAGQEQYAGLMALAPAMDQYLTEIEQEAKVKSEAAKALQASYSSLAGIINDALSPLSDAEKTLADANDAMLALGMSGLTYRDALVILDSYDNDALIELADTLGLSFEEIQTIIQQIINGNEQITGGGSGVLSFTDAQSAVDAATTTLSVAQDDVWNYADVINESFGGVIPTLKEFNAVFGDLGSDELATIKSTYSDLIDQVGGLPGSIGELRENYFDQFDSLELVEPTEGIAEQISGVYVKFLGRLPDADGLDWWVDKFNRGESFESIKEGITGGLEAALYDAGGINLDVFNAFKDIYGRLPTQSELNDYFAEIVGDPPESANGYGWVSKLDLSGAEQSVINDLEDTAEAGLYEQFKDLEGDYSHYLDSAADSDGPAGLGVALQQLETAKVNLGAAQKSLSNAMASGTESVADSTNNAAASFLQGIKSELVGFDLEGEQLEQYELTLWYDGMVAQANNLGVELTQLNELYGKKQVAITEKYADEAAEALQKALDFDTDIQSQIDSFDLEGEALELFQLDEWRESLIEQAETVGGDLVKVQELYSLKRAAIVAEQQVEDSGLNTYLQSVSDYVNDQTLFIKDSYADQIALVEQWQDVAKGLRDYVDQIRLSELSTDTPSERLEHAKELYTDLLEKANSGDIEAAQKLTSAADTYLNESDAYYGRSEGYISIFDDVTNELDKLGVEKLEANGEDEINRLQAKMTSELEDLSKYAQDELDWAEKQAQSLTNIDTALGDWPSQFEGIIDGLNEDAKSTEETELTQPQRSSVDLTIKDPDTSAEDAASSQPEFPTQSADTDTLSMSLSQAIAIIRDSFTVGVNATDYQQAAATLGITSFEQLADFLRGDTLNQIEASTQESATLQEVADKLGKLDPHLQQAYLDDVRRQYDEMANELGIQSQYAEDGVEWERLQSTSLTDIALSLGNWPTTFSDLMSTLASTIADSIASRPVNTQPEPEPYAPDLYSNYWDLKAEQDAATSGTASVTDSSYQPTVEPGTSTEIASSGMTTTDAAAIIHASMNGPVKSVDFQIAAETLGITSYQEVISFVDGSHARGLSRVPFNGYRAKLHKDEMVLTADVSNHIRRSMDAVESTPGQRSHTEMLVELRALRESNQRLETELAALRFERKAADNTSSQQRDQQIYAAKSLIRANRSTVETV